MRKASPHSGHRGDVMQPQVISALRTCRVARREITEEERLIGIVDADSSGWSRLITAAP